MLSENGSATAVMLLCSATALVLVARSIERRRSMGDLAACDDRGRDDWPAHRTNVAVAVPAIERAQGAGGALLMLTPCWILLSLGWRAHRSDAPLRRPCRYTQRVEPRATGAAFRQGARIVCDGDPHLRRRIGPRGIDRGRGRGAPLLLAGLVYWPIAVLAGRMWARGRRQSAVGVREIRKLDTRPPVLLLRSFADDNLPLGKRDPCCGFCSPPNNS
jgi:hypothetical protein